MKCSVCGSELPENSKFCVYCGNTVKPAAPETPTYNPPAYNTPSYNYGTPTQEQPTYAPPSYTPQNSLYQQPSYTTPSYNPQTAPAAPAYSAPSYTDEKVVVPAKPVNKGKKHKKAGKGIAIVSLVAAILIVVAVIGIVVLNLPSVKIPMALSRSLNAYAGIADDIGLTKALDFLKDEASTESLTLTFEGINDMIAEAAAADGVNLSQLESLGIRLDSSASLSDRRMSASIAAVYDGSDLIKADFGVDDDTIWGAVPDLLAGKYGIKTSTLGKDLVEMGSAAVGEDIESLGFNIFDMIELIKTMKPSEDIEKEFEKAAKDLVKELEIEADGSDDIKVNGERISCSKYDVTIPQDALEDYLDAIEDPMEDAMKQTLDVYEDLFRSIGMPEDILDEMMDEMEPSMDMGMYMDGLKEGLDYIGDVELELYIKGGYVMAVIYELEVDDETMVLTVNMGGEGKYVDDFSVTVEVEDYFTFELASSGNHTGKGGEFTDETEINVEIDRERFSVNMESRYAPKEKKDNFSWELTVGGDYIAGIGLEAEGQLTLGKNNLHMVLDQLSLAVAGMDMVTLGLDYSIGEYTGAAEAGSVKYITKLTEDDIMAMSEEIMTNAQTFAEKLTNKLPFIEELLNEQVVDYPAVEAYPYDDPYYYG